MLLRMCICSFVLALLAVTSRAETTLPVVLEYGKAADKATWSSHPHLFRGENPLPKSLISQIRIADPSMAYRAPYNNVFLQNERIVVCNTECDQPQNLTPKLSGPDFLVPLKPGKSRKTEKLNDSIIRQATVYYWINQLFDRMAQLGYQPKKRLVVYVDRVVRDPENGVIEDNNAFFNGKDWTLSFLPAENSPITLAVGGGFHFASAYDPSVAMHETTHSVFEELIGPILNHEILGLHEAFADYFAMSVLNSPVIGRVMAKGKALRDASQAPKYEADMEAHDLGHVVGSALWAIRGLFRDKLLADRVALETIRETSRDPFATAASVVVAYASALERMAPSSGLLEPVMKIWQSSGLIPKKPKIDLAAISGKIDSKEYSVTTFSVEVPDWVTLSQGQPKREQITLGFIDTRPGPEGSKTVWVLISVEDGETATPYWLLYSPSSKNILAAYDVNQKPVLSDLTKIGDALEDCIKWNIDFGKSAVDTFRAQFKPRKLFGLPIFPSLKSDQRTSGMTRINNRLVPMTGHFVTLRGPILPVKLLLKAILGKHYNEFESVKGVRLLTVASRDLKNNRLPEVFPGERIIGYQIVTLTGVVKTTMLEGIAE